MKKKNIKLNIVLPKGASTSTDFGLVELTRQIRLKTGKEGGFGLGGQDGYGIEYENEVFSMNPFCWCDSDNCKLCSGEKPNFLYKSTDCGISWYKYIGRDQEQNGILPKDWLKKCIESIWDKNDCWYEYDVSIRDVSEGLMGRIEPQKIKLNFNVSDKDAYVEAQLSPFAVDGISYWGLDDIISDIGGEFESEPLISKIEKLNKKYPKLRKKIKQDAIERNEMQIRWHRNRIKELMKLL